MGFPTEFNWYLVIDKEEEMIDMGLRGKRVMKSGIRIYPINGLIPLIVKNKGCIGIVRIDETLTAGNNTIIDFKNDIKLDLGSEVSQHYYGLYLRMKSEPEKPEIKEFINSVKNKGEREMKKEATREMIEVINGLATAKYTKVMREKETSFKAPHNFEVLNSETSEVLASVHFQEGAIKECGINGVMGEDLINMVIERLKCFQDSEFACRENAMAITKFEEGLMWFRKRTMDREARGVEGTHKV